MPPQVFAFALSFSHSLINSQSQNGAQRCVYRSLQSLQSHPRFPLSRTRAVRSLWSMSSKPTQEPSRVSSEETRASDFNFLESEGKTHSHETETHHSGNSDDNGGDNGNHNNNDHGDQPEGDGDQTSTSAHVDLKESADEVKFQMRSFVKSPLTKSFQLYQKSLSTFLSWVVTVMKTVPAPVLVAFISLISTVSGARIKSRRDAQAAERKRIEECQKKKIKIENELRQFYNDLVSPMLKSAVKLAEMLHVLIDSDWEVAETKEADSTVSPLYLAYLMGRYLATVEIVKEKSALLDYGFPAADRILGNILGRLQGVMAANDTILADMQTKELLFKPEQGKKPLRGGPLRLTPRAQTVLGELILRKIWKDKCDFVDPAENADLRVGMKAMINYLEFCQIYSKNETMQVWFRPLVRDFEKLKQAVQQMPPEKRRVDKIGARVFFLQSSLLDLAEFFDPLPYPKFVPFSRRRRLRLGPVGYNEEQRVPMSLHKLYTELANIRDHKLINGDIVARLRLRHGVEVFVNGAYGTGENKVRKLEPGDCPFSQRVLITLQEMKIPYTAIPIAPDAKPGWYYLLHPQGRTPTLYHDGEVVEESAHIVRYLRTRFPSSKALASADHLKLAVGTGSFTRFHGYFKKWLKGNSEARLLMENELRKLNTVLERAQEQKGGTAFLGGSSFSREDTAIVPMLHNVEVAGRALRDWTMPRDLKAVWRYIEEARAVPSFTRTVPKDSTIIEGYHRMARRGSRPNWWFADLLE